MESDLQQHPPMFLDHHHHHHHQHQHQQMNSGLTRFRSAPSSYFSNIIDKEFYDSIFNNKPSSPETERIFARFMNSLSNDEGVASASATEPEQDSSLDNKNLAPVQQQQIPVVKQEVINNNNNNSSNLQPQALAPMNNETVILQQQQQQQRNIGSNYGSSGAPSQSFYQSSGRPPLPNQMKTGRGNASNLIRHGSSPAGLFSNINIEGYAAAIRGMGTMGAGSNKTSEDASFSPATRLKKNNAQGYSSSGLMSPIAEIRNTNNTENEAFGESQQQGNDFISGLPVSSWDDSSSMISDNITGLKRYREEDVKPFSALNPAPETQNETGGGQGCAAPLSHQLSMPNTSAEIAAIEKFLNCSSDSVVCKIRAKRGCATHPRSIAERVRRTKISERMRKLQDLVPNMDKQTNTADMLDLAVEYIKDLQKQVETLSDSHAKCTCSHKQQHQ